MHYSLIFKNVESSNHTCDDDSYDLTRADVQLLLSDLERFEATYFKDFPLIRELSEPFVLSIPQHIIEAIQHAHDENLPDVMNPALLMYPLFAENAVEAYGVFLNKLEDLIFSDSTGAGFIRKSIAAWDRQMDQSDTDMDDPEDEDEAEDSDDVDIDEVFEEEDDHVE